MTKLQALLEISYLLGAEQSLESELINQEKEMLIDNFGGLVENIYEDFQKWYETIDESELEALHQYLATELDAAS